MKSLVAIFLMTTGFAVSQTIVCPEEAPDNVKLAAREIRRYVYLRTGNLLPLAENGNGFALKIDPALAAQEYRISPEGITGGSDVGLLYGAYRYAECLGVRFYLHGDVIPDEKLSQLPRVTDSGKPLFSLRGLNPWGSHPFGFDAWGTDDYKAIITQLAKMRMNFIGIHCYPEGYPYAEPTVWHGLPGDFDDQGRVNASYPSRYYNTLITTAWGNYRTMKTSDNHLGGAMLFEDDAWSPEVMRGHCPLPATPEACNEVFNRTAAQFKEAFSFARLLGVKTCIGSETPLMLPKNLAARGTDTRAIYEATFRRIMAAHPLDYYWLWTPEDWTWQGNKPEQYASAIADVRHAIQGHKDAGAPFKLATCGWVLGPQHDRAAFDNDLPKDIPMSAISRGHGTTEVDPAFGRIEGREKWAIPWLEADGGAGLGGVQLWAGRMRRDAADALKYECTGLMGLQWRTEILSPNASALAQAAWGQSWDKGGAWTAQGQVIDYPDAVVAGTADIPLYRSCRYGLGNICLQVPAGKYKVTLKFCEPHFSSAGERIFDVQVQGKTVMTDFDIFAEVGQFAARDFSLDDVVVTDGTLAVELVARKSLPCISAIAVEGPGFVRKINLGGAAYRDWMADGGAPPVPQVDDFYADWAQANFGCTDAGSIFAAIDGKAPVVTKNGCPSGSLDPVEEPWATIAPQFAFIDQLEKQRPEIKGAGNLDRFDYWLNTFKYLRSLMQTRCAMGAKQPDDALKAWTEAYTYLLATVNSPGALAMVVNMENHPGWGPLVAGATGKSFAKTYAGQPRLIVPTVRSLARKDETLRLKIIALDRQPVRGVIVKFRPLGGKDWQAISAKHMARATYTAELPALRDDIEYHITAETADGRNIVWPATAPELNQTIVITR